jgi:predicted transcriptional regulator
MGKGILSKKILVLLENSPGQTIKELATQLAVNRTFLSGYLRALEDQGFVKSKEVGPARVYFKGDSK